MSEYPDHLNPFKEKKRFGRSLTTSFRELKGFIRQSFRKKKSGKNLYGDFHEVEIRRTQDVASIYTLRNEVMSLPSRATYSSYTLISPPLPRSRFKERLSRSSLNTFNTSYDERCNPFAEDGLNPFDVPPIPHRRRKSKNRAPLPPSCSNPDMNADYGNKGSSKWSLTSSETDYSFDNKSEYSGDVTYPKSLRECLDNFNREMTTLNKESFEIGGSSPNILDHSRNGQDEETDNNRKQISSNDSIRYDSREINNNEPNLQVSHETIPTKSEIKTQMIIFRGEQENTVGKKHIPENTVDNEIVIKDDLTDIKENIQNGTSENSELGEMEDMPIKSSDKTGVPPIENSEDEEGTTKTIVLPEFQVISETVKENQIDKENNGTVNLENFNDINREFRVDEVKMKYIDDEILNEKFTEGELVISVDGTDSKIRNSPPKQRKYKLDKVVLLGEDSRSE